MTDISNRRLLEAVQTVLDQHLLEELGLPENHMLSIRTFEEASLLTDNQGLVVTIGGWKGKKFQLSLLGSSRHERDE